MPFHGLLKFTAQLVQLIIFNHQTYSLADQLAKEHGNIPFIFQP